MLEPGPLGVTELRPSWQAEKGKKWAVLHCEARHGFISALGVLGMRMLPSLSTVNIGQTTIGDTESFV